VKLSRRENAFEIINVAILVICAVVSILPVFNVIAQSLSGISAVASRKVWFWPISFNFEGWRFVLYRTNYLNALKNSLIITSVGTIGAVVVTTLTAYTLSKPFIKGRSFFIYTYVFFLFFNVGIVPLYFQISSYNMLNTLWALILPTMVNPFYMFVLKKGLESMPESLEEAAKIDGASNFRILCTIVVPVQKASIATIIVFYSVNYWNKYFDALLYITRRSLQPVPLFLFELVKEFKMSEGLGEVDLAARVSPEIMQASAVVLTVLPILAAYPLMQKYFVKGVAIGAVKG
jgi:putative aldouronate transport system permease protein